MEQYFQRKGSITLDQLEVFPIKGEHVGSDAAGAQCQEDIVQHLLDFGFPAGLFAGRLGNDLSRLLPILKRGGDHTAGSFKSPNIRFN
jgi:hypothetical protein